MVKTKNQPKPKVSDSEVEPQVQAEASVRDNECPNCHETNWADVVANNAVVEKQHQCRNCGYVLTEE